MRCSCDAHDLADPATAGRAETLKWLTDPEQAYAAAVNILREQAERQSDQQAVQADLVQELVSWTVVLLPDRPADAREILEEATARIAVELTGRYPSIRQYSDLRIEALGMMSWLEMDRGNEARAVELAVELAEKALE